MNFNLEDYEPVEERLARFHKKYPNGRVITDVVNYTDTTILVKAHLFREYEDEKPYATGFAEETKGVGSPVNKLAHVENCETSAVGRALANGGFAPKNGKRPSREEMQKVARGEKKEEQRPLIDTPDGQIRKKNTAIKNLYRVVAERLEQMGSKVKVADACTKLILQTYKVASYSQLTTEQIDTLAKKVEEGNE